MIRHDLSYELINDLFGALSNHEHWMVYNSALYNLEKGDVNTFRDRDTAQAFVDTKNRHAESFRLIWAGSMTDVYTQIPYERNFFIPSKNTTMNEQNLEYLKDNLRYMGFGEKLYPQLEKELQNGQPQFQLHLETEMNRKTFSAVLNFRKSDNTDMYFFNSYHASLKRTNGEVVDQAFYLNKGKGVTAKEAYNLLEGRAVYKELTNKEGQSYHAWLQLDLTNRDKHNNHEVKQFHEKYGFNLPDALQKFPIKEMQSADLREVLLQSLQKGNLQAVTFIQEGSVSRMFIEAAPQFKSVNVYDGNLKRVQKEDLHQHTGKAQSTGKEPDQKQAPQVNSETKRVNGNAVESPVPGKTRSRKRTVGK